MKFVFVTLFPEEMRQYFMKGIVGRAVSRAQLDVSFVDLRSFALDKHARVDDYPFGGRPGMLLKADVLSRAITSIDRYEEYRLLYACPKGPVFTQKQAVSLVNNKGLIFICGYYEGVDERLFSRFSIERFSLGNFILTSGELPSLVVSDVVARLVPGVLGNSTSVDEESIISGLLEYPQYTAPRLLDSGEAVPEILVGGHHRLIAEWQRRESLKETVFTKPSLLWDATLTDTDGQILVEILKEASQCHR